MPSVGTANHQKMRKDCRLPAVLALKEKRKMKKEDCIFNFIIQKEYEAKKGYFINIVLSL